MILRDEDARFLEDGRQPTDGGTMEKRAEPCATVDEYIEGFPEDVRTILRKIRTIIREEAPSAAERIAYGMPTYSQGGNLVHFAAYARHIGLYPTPSGIDAFKAELSAYKGAKGSVQFPLSGEMPYDLIRRIVRYRVAERQA